eukprot:TRINITY_DN14560_c0_g1_i1.p1 TRINITY_DN14560_c0_g1~~TRINITY_DN14560_c0_g1_i1.p1  ORF type:complete len:282 (-),score=38.92 TRINITY_DN14560_c0_g1_i1:169-1014(-)
MASSLNVHLWHSTMAKDVAVRQSNFSWDAFRGIAVSLAEITVFGQAAVYFKNMLQTKQKPVLNPAHWYRGYFVNAASIAPITALQMAVNGKLENYFTTYGLNTLTQGQKTTCALMAGAIAAVVASPAELIILRQQRMGQSIAQAGRDILASRGITGFARGFIPTAGRDALFSFGYIAGAPIVSAKIQESGGGKLAAIGGMVGVGVVAGLGSHPIDCIKTQLQNPDGDAKRGIFGVTKDLYSSGGIGAFYKGALARTSRVVVSVVMYSELARIMDEHRPEWW